MSSIPWYERKISTCASSQKPRVTHRRFKNLTPIYDPSRKGEADRIVSIVWCYDHLDETLVYGATVWTSTEGDRCWDRKKHLERAMDRYFWAPVIIPIFFDYIEEPTYIDADVVDWYIARHLIFILGTHCNDEEDDEENDGSGEEQVSKPFHIYPGEDFKRNYIDTVEQYKERYFAPDGSNDPYSEDLPFISESTVGITVLSVLISGVFLCGVLLSTTN